MIRSMSLGVKKLTYDSIIPTRGSDGAVGYDLYSNMSCVIRASERGLVSTGITIVLPPGVYGRVAPRSGLAVKHGIQVGAGVIDPDYTGEVKVILFNHGDKDFEVKKGDRIAQLVLEKCETPPIKEINIVEDTDRGSGGFGSTGN
jgi:dUTP pyrophosphatase